MLERSREIDVHLPKTGKGTITLAKVEIESTLADERVLAQERTPESSPLQTTIPTQSTHTTSTSPVPEHTQIRPMGFAAAVPEQIVGSFPDLGMTVETDPNGGARVVSTTPGGIAEWIDLRVGYVITAVNDKSVGTVADFAAAMADRALGSPIKLSYMLRTNLGNFQKDTTIALSNEHR